MATDAEPAEIWLAIPDGYAELPLTDVAAITETTGRLVTELGTPEQRSAAGYALDSLRFLLTALGERRAVYCGFGRHHSAIDGSLITSSLVVTLLEFPDTRNPKLLLRDLLQAEAGDGVPARVDLVELSNGPALFVERTRPLPTPHLPGFPERGDTPVWQLTASIPSPRGDRLATIEVSTGFAAHGPQYRPMAVTLASAIAFEPPQNTDPLAALLG